MEYSLLVVVSDDLRQHARESAQKLASMTPDSSIRAAALLRQINPRLASDQQRTVAEEMARRFEERAAAHSQRSSS